MSALTDVCQKRERESKQMSREKRLKKHSSQPSSSVLRRQKGAKWVIIVFYTDKDREGEGGRVGVGFRYTLQDVAKVMERVLSSASDQ